MRGSCRPIFLLGLALAAGSIPALAQPARVSDYPACTAGQTVSKADSEAAHRAYLAGKDQFDVADYATAITNFRVALGRDCTKYELLNIIARAYELKGDRTEAINALDVYLKRAQADPNGNDQVAQIKLRLQNLRALPPQPTASSDASTAASASAAPPAASAPSSATAGATTTATTDSHPAPEVPVRGHTATPWIVVVGGVAVTAVGAVLLGVGLGKIGSLGDTCPNLTCPSEGAAAKAQSDQSSGNTLSVVGGIVGGIGLVAVIGGLVWHFTEPTGPTPAGANLRVRFAPDVGAGRAGGAVVGTF